MPLTKKCSSCHKPFPPTAAFFYRNAAHADQLANVCRSCESKAKKAARKAKREKADE